MIHLLLSQDKHTSCLRHVVGSFLKYYPNKSCTTPVAQRFKRGSAADRLLGFLVRVALGTLMSVSYECCACV